MTSRKPRLELTWIGKDERPRLEPRILLEDPSLSGHASKRVADNDIFDNILIQGDNLLALKALEGEFSGRVNCICIDPPYNTGSAFEHYDDGLEHSLWLSLMRDRLEILKQLLAPSGSIWVIIDDNEAQYLKVLCDEIFGRSDFVGTVVWQHSVQGKNDSRLISLHHNYVLAYRRSDRFQRNLLPRTDEHNVNYRNPDEDPRGQWRSGDVRSPHYRENLRYVVATPSGKKIRPPENGWRWSKATFMEKVASGEITFVDGDTRVLRKIYLANQDGRIPESIWLGDDVGTTREASAEVAALIPPGVVPFATPKPERLLQRILTIATNPGDLVLDSFAGSGTAGAVAHKMGRRWIMVELGEHAVTHIVPRLKKVTEGQDPGGITEACAWKGGGGFRFYRLAPSLLEQDRWGRWVINKTYNAAMLAEAVCRIEGFRYEPDPQVFWMHGRSTERDCLYVTTQNLSRDQLRFLSGEVGPDRTLLICCSAFRAKAEEFENLTIKKIPLAVLARCEWGKDDYSLNIQNLPPPEPPVTSPAGTADGSEPADTLRAKGRGRPKIPKEPAATPLFDGPEGDA